MSQRQVDHRSFNQSLCCMEEVYHENLFTYLWTKSHRENQSGQQRRTSQISITSLNDSLSCYSLTVIMGLIYLIWVDGITQIALWNLRGLKGRWRPFMQAFCPRGRSPLYISGKYFLCYPEATDLCQVCCWTPRMSTRMFIRQNERFISSTKKPSLR